MTSKFLGLAVGIAATFAAIPAMAQQRWETIGFKAVGAGTDRDVVRVRGAQRHRQIRVCALNRAVNMQDLDVRFANGTRQDLPVRRTINAGTCTGATDLRGRRRDVSEVRLRYSKFARGTLPVVRIQAR